MVRQTIGWTISPSWYLNLDLDSLYSLWTIISCNKHFTHSHITIRHHPFPCLKEKDFPSTLVELLSRIDPHCKSRSTSISIHHNHFLYQLSGVLSLICKPNVSPLIPNPRDSIDNPLNPFQPNEYGIAFSHPHPVSEIRFHWCVLHWIVLLNTYCESIDCHLHWTATMVILRIW